MPWQIFLSIFAYLLIPSKTSDFTSDLERITMVYNCDPFCIFNESEITSRTVQFFPKSCDAVCGILTLNQNTDLTESEIKNLFKTMTTLYGALRFESTTFSNFNFFGKTPGMNSFDFFCETFGLTIFNNTELTDISFLNGFFLFKDRLTEECTLKFEKNPKLDARFLCEHRDFKGFFEMKVSGNLKVCGCRGDWITSENVNSLKDCEKVEGGLHISNITDSTYLTRISHIKGDVEIRNTNFKDLTFFENLKEIQTKHGLIAEKVSVNICDNSEMIRFGIEGLTKLYDILNGPFIWNFEKLNPDFCLTFEELLFFLENGIAFENIHAKFCTDSKDTKIDGDEVCEFESLKTLKSICYFIHGNIVVDSKNEQYTYKLEVVNTLFGTLTIKETTVKNLRFLSTLKHIVSLEEDYVIKILENQNLVSAELPLLRNIITKDPRTVVLDKNPILESDNCMIFRITYQTNVAFIGDNCDAPSSSSSYHHTYFSILTFCFSCFLVFGNQLGNIIIGMF